MDRNEMEKINNVLGSLGYEIKAIEMEKNGVRKKGFTVFRAEEDPDVENRISPVFYEEMFEGKRVEEILHVILFALANPGIDVSKDFILRDKVFLGLIARENAGELLTRPCPVLPGLDYFMYVQVNGNPEYVSRIKGSNLPAVLGTLGMETSGELWKVAEANTKFAATCNKLGGVMEELFGVNEPEPDDFGLYVLTTKDMALGAGAICATDKLKAVAEASGSDKMVIIPSSVHELLVFSVPEDTTEDCLPWYSEMVREVNCDPTMMHPEDRLCDSAFFLDVSEL